MKLGTRWRSCGSEEGEKEWTRPLRSRSALRLPSTGALLWLCLPMPITQYLADCFDYYYYSSRCNLPLLASRFRFRFPVDEKQYVRSQPARPSCTYALMASIVRSKSPASRPVSFLLRRSDLHCRPTTCPRRAGEQQRRFHLRRLIVLPFKPCRFLFPPTRDCTTSDLQQVVLIYCKDHPLDL
jgi:hypothetical protein